MTFVTISRQCRDSVITIYFYSSLLSKYCLTLPELHYIKAVLYRQTVENG